MAEVSALARKLGIKAGMTVVVVNLPDGVLDLLEPLPDGATVAAADARTPAGLVLLFAADAAALTAAWPAAQAAVGPGGLVWIAYRKGGVAAGTDINRDILWEHMKPHGVTGVTLVAVDKIWSAMRFRPTEEVGT